MSESLDRRCDAILAIFDAVAQGTGNGFVAVALAKIADVNDIVDVNPSLGKLFQAFPVNGSQNRLGSNFELRIEHLQREP